MAHAPLSAEDFNEIKIVSDPQISPDGTCVAFVHQSVDRDENKYRSAIWLLPTDGGPPRPFTAGTGRDWLTEGVGLIILLSVYCQGWQFQDWIHE